MKGKLLALSLLLAGGTVAPLTADSKKCCKKGGFMGINVECKQCKCKPCDTESEK